MLGPIFAREWVTVPRRANHYVSRVVALGMLWMLGVTAWQAVIGFHRSALLGETAHFGLIFTQLVTFSLLTVVMVFAAFSAASAVAREKDRRTFILLLLSDMRDHEIVLGKMLGSLLPISLLLMGVVPILAMLPLLGGISPEQVGQALAILIATAVGAGAVGVVIALWRERTFQAIALSLLMLMLYLGTVRILPFLPGGLDWPSAQLWLDPYLALAATLDPNEAVAIPPAFGYAATMGLIAVALTLLGIVKLRAWNPKGEPIMQRERPEDEDADRTSAHAAPGAPRPVWPNPVLWREIRTAAYGRRPILVKAAYAVVLALVCYAALAPLSLPTNRTPFAVAYGMVPVLVVSLLLVAAQAVTAITSERDTGSLDLLLVTDLTPNEFVFGKILGVLYNVKEYVLPPLLLAGVYAYIGLLATPPRTQPELLGPVNRDALLAVIGGSLVLLAFALMLGLHVALRITNSQWAVAHALGTILFLSVGTLVCVYLIVINNNFESQWTSFVGFVAVGIGGLFWVLSADRPSGALTLASFALPMAVFYCVLNLLVAKPGSEETTDPLVPFLVMACAFGFAISAMLVPLLSEFDVALGRTSREE